MWKPRKKIARGLFRLVYKTLLSLVLVAVSNVSTMKSLPKLPCFVCKKTVDVKKLNETKVNKCLNILAYRKAKRFKYGDLLLTRENSVNYGYHVRCYKKFISLRRKYKEEMEALFSSNESVSVIVL